jgi:hypothetical protein
LSPQDSPLSRLKTLLSFLFELDGSCLHHEFGAFLLLLVEVKVIDVGDVVL